METDSDDHRFILHVNDVVRRTSWKVEPSRITFVTTPPPSPGRILDYCFYGTYPRKIWLFFVSFFFFFFFFWSFIYTLSKTVQGFHHLQASQTLFNIFAEVILSIFYALRKIYAMISELRAFMSTLSAGEMVSLAAAWTRWSSSRPASDPGNASQIFSGTWACSGSTEVEPCPTCCLGTARM